MRKTTLYFIPLFLALFHLTAFSQTELDAIIKDLENNKSIKDRKVNLRNIHFKTGTATLLKSDKEYLDSLSESLKKIPTVTLEISGHTDNVGRVQLNNKLSSDRANAVRNYLISTGSSSKRIRAIGYGSNQPIADNTTEAGRLLNRRVEMMFLGLTNDIHKIYTKAGKQIPATFIVIGNEGTISYKMNEADDLLRLRADEIDYILYADGTRYTPTVIIVNDRTNKPYEKEEEKEVSKDVNTSYSLESVKGPQWLINKFPKITRWSVLLNAGIVPFTVKGSVIDFFYVDQSPSRDNLQSYIDLKAKKFGYGGQVGLEWAMDNHIVWRAQYQMAWNSEGGTKGLVFGVGKGLGRKGHIIPSLDLTLGNSFIKLGDIYQNDVFIQIHKKKMYSEKVSVKFRNYFAALTPQINMDLPVSRRANLRATVGYSYGFHTRSVLSFVGYDENDKKVKEKEKLSASNVTFKVDGEEKTDASLFNLRGIHANLGIVYHIYKK